MYFKAYISITTEDLMTDGSCDPDTFQDHGEIETFTKPTLAELKTEIGKRYFNLEKPIGADVQIFDGSIDICHLEQNLKTGQEYYENIRIMISKVDETFLDLSNEDAFKGVSK